MAEITNGYVGLEQVKKALGSTSASQDDLIGVAIEAASRRVDNYCGRRFWRDTEDRVAYFKSLYGNRRLRLVGPPTVADLVIDDITEVATAPRSTPDTFTATTAYAVDRSGRFPDVTQSLMATVGGGWPRRGVVRVTGLFGIAAPPTDVVTGAQLQAERLFKRLVDSPMGAQVVVQGQAPVTIAASRYPDGDVQQMLDDYQLRLWQ